MVKLKGLRMGKRDGAEWERGVGSKTAEEFQQTRRLKIRPTDL